MFKFKKQIFSVAMFFLLAMPFVTKAAGVIPCATDATNQRACTLCDFIVGFHNIIQYGMNIIIIVAITGITFAGVMYVISSGDQKLMEQAKGFLKASLIGFTFVFLGWLIISITMWLLSAKTDLGVIPSGGSWNKFTCSTVSTSGQTSGSTNTQSK